MKRGSNESPAPNAKKVRLTLDLNAELYTRLQHLEKVTGVESKATLVRQALQLYEYIVERTVEGCKFNVLTPDGKEQGLIFLGHSIKHPK